jgi:hypothetical protein
MYQMNNGGGGGGGSRHSVVVILETATYIKNTSIRQVFSPPIFTWYEGKIYVPVSNNWTDVCIGYVCGQMAIMKVCMNIFNM